MRRICFRFWALLVLFSAMVSSELYAQDPDSNALKYWEYRERMMYDHQLRVGTNFGESMVGFRGPEKDFHIGDGCTKLGHYIAVLATEYELLRRNGYNTERTVMELYYALSAINRLDYYAETYYTDATGKPGKASLNGFFVRDDLHDLNTYQLAHLNTDTLYRTVDKRTSDFAMGSLNNEMSKDQVFHLLLGLRLVQRYIDSTVSWQGRPFDHYSTAYQNASIEQEAINIGKRLIEYMSSNVDTNALQADSTAVISLPSVPSRQAWDILNPVTNIPVKRGQNAFFNSYSIQRIYDAFSGERTNLYHSRRAEYAAKRLFKTATGSFWTNTVIREGEGRNLLTPLATANSHDEATLDYLLTHCLHKRHADDFLFDWLPYANALLFGTTHKNADAYETEMQRILNEAPQGKIYAYGSNDYATDEWSCSSRTIQPEQRKGRSPGHAFGEYNGLDYLLMYNLFCLYHQKHEHFLPHRIAYRYAHFELNSRLYGGAFRISGAMPMYYNLSHTEQGTQTQAILLNGRPGDPPYYFSSMTGTDPDQHFAFHLVKPYSKPAPSLLNTSKPFVLGNSAAGTEWRSASLYIHDESVFKLAATQDGTEPVFSMHHFSEVHILEGGSMIIDANTILDLKQGSSIHVHGGGHLYIHPDAQVYLHDADCTIDFYEGALCGPDPRHDFLFPKAESQQSGSISFFGKGSVIYSK